MKLYDTAKGKVTELTLRNPKEVSMYVCGPTVYAPPHLGHGRFALNFDILRRYLLYLNYKVIYVSNITDIDDKIIQRANQENKLTNEIAATYENKWFEDMGKLNILKPTYSPHATEYIEAMVDLIKKLVEEGYAYETEDGIYLEVSKIQNYGCLSKQDVNSLKSGARVGVDEKKKSPLDFTLWKLSKPSEPSWPSPFGMGRPGWHTECVVMSLQLLGEGFDIHGGAQDLIFPHHENEVAQATALSQKFANHWVHCGFVTVSGEKMSKSLNNYTTLEELLAFHDARSLRLLILQSHYRSPLEITKETLETADTALARLDSAYRRFRDQYLNPPDYSNIKEMYSKYFEEFELAMNNDLDTPKVTSQLFNLISQANTMADNGQIQEGAEIFAVTKIICESLGLELKDSSEELDPTTLDLVAKRDAARINKDFKTADEIRDRLALLGWTVEDTALGTRVHR